QLAQRHDHRWLQHACSTFNTRSVYDSLDLVSRRSNLDSSVRSPAFRSFLLLLFIPSRPLRLPSRMAERIKLTLPASQNNTILYFPPLSPPGAQSTRTSPSPPAPSAATRTARDRQPDGDRVHMRPVCRGGAASVVGAESDLGVNVRAGRSCSSRPGTSVTLTLLALYLLVLYNFHFGPRRDGRGSHSRAGCITCGRRGGTG
ncbi:hypothetical protein B0H14DRAFT_3637474, partial [Mycena olivaceomarginata]